MTTSSQATYEESLSTPERAPFIRIQTDGWTLIFLCVFAFSIFLRVSHLGEMALHHDESLYARYCWNLYQGQGYRYDPLQHGPFMFHASALYMFLFGDSDETVRMLMATLGIATLLMVWAWRHNKEFGAAAGAIAVALIGFSPTTTYFNRFFRHDTPFAFWAMLIPTAYILFQKTKRNAYLYLMAAAFAGMYCTKENAFVTTIVLVGFAILYAGQQVVARGKGLRGLVEVMDEHPFLSKWFIFVNTWGFFIVFFAIQHVREWEWFSSDSPQQVNTAGEWYFTGMFLFFIALAAGLVFIQEQYRNGSWPEDRPFLGMPGSFYRDGFVFAMSFFLFGAICVLLYTSFFTSPNGALSTRSFQGIWDGSGRWFVYWYHQHHIARIKGPYLYYVPHMMLYEHLTLTVFLFTVALRLVKRWVFGAVVAGYAVLSGILVFAFNRMTPGEGLRGMIESTFLKPNDNLFLFPDFLLAVGGLFFGAYFVWTLLEDRRPLRAFVYSWAILAFLIYSYLQEKVPWLGMHIIFPMHLAVAMALGDFWYARVRRPVRLLGWAAVLLLSTGVIHSTFELIWYNNDNAVEQMVYVQTHRDMKRVADEIEEIADYLGMGHQMPMGIAGDSSWPLMWYLRDYKNVTWAVTGENKPVQITNWSDKDRFERMLPNYVGRRYQLRHWWIPSTQEWLNIPILSDEFKQNPFAKLFGDKKVNVFHPEFVNLTKYYVYRKRWNPAPNTNVDRYGSVDVILWVHRDLYDVHTWEMMSNNRVQPYNPQQGWKAPEPVVRERAPQPTADAPRTPRVAARNLSPAPAIAFGRNGTQLGQLAEPRGVTVDPAGHIYVADTINHRIQKFSPEGSPMAAWGMKGTEPGQFDHPTGIVFAQGRIYVADTWNHRIQVLNPENGEVVTTFGGPEVFWAPKGITYDSATGDLFIVVTGSHVVKRFSLDGQERNSFGGLSKEGVEGMFFEPVGVTVGSDNNLYIGDTANQRIQVFSKDGRFLRQWEVDGFTDFFTEPMLVADAQGRIYVTDASTGKIDIFNREGDLVAEWTGSGGHRFVAPKGIAIGANGKVYVTDVGAHKVFVFNALPM